MVQPFNHFEKDHCRRYTTGATELGSCLTDVTREGSLPKSRSCVTAMLWPERVTQQSSRPFDPVESFRPPRHEGGNKILDEDMQMSSELIRRDIRCWPLADIQVCTCLLLTQSGQRECNALAQVFFPQRSGL